MTKIRLGFIGAGWWATTNHMPLLAARGDVELRAVCRLGTDLLETVRQKFGFEFATQDYLELLDQDLDAVVISTPHHLHFEQAKAALERGLHVMCEKPLTLAAAQAWELVELAERRGLVLLVPYGWHYKPFIQRAKALMTTPGIGKLEYALCHMASPINYAGEGGVPSQWSDTLAAPDPTTWQVKSNGGGYAHGQITHSSALLLWLTGLRASRVSARLTTAGSPIDRYCAASVTLDNDAIAAFSGAAALPRDAPFQVDLRLFGTEGVLLLDVERERLELRRHDGKVISLEIPNGAGAYSCEGPPARFIELIHGRGSNDSSGEVAARSVELIQAMYRSEASGGQPVTVQPQGLT